MLERQVSLLTSTLTAHLVVHHDLITCPAYQSVPTSKHSPPVTWPPDVEPAQGSLPHRACPGASLQPLLRPSSGSGLNSSKPSALLSLVLVSAVDSGVCLTEHQLCARCQHYLQSPPQTTALRRVFLALSPVPVMERRLGDVRARAEVQACPARARLPDTGCGAGAQTWQRCGPSRALTEHTCPCRVTHP